MHPFASIYRPLCLSFKNAFFDRHKWKHKAQCHTEFTYLLTILSFYHCLMLCTCCVYLMLTFFSFIWLCQLNFTDKLRSYKTICHQNLSSKQYISNNMKTGFTIKLKNKLLQFFEYSIKKNFKMNRIDLKVFKTLYLL